MDKQVEYEDVMVNGQPTRLEYESISVGDLELDPDNPRIKYRLGLKPGVSAKDELAGWSNVVLLRKDIEKSGGLRERIIVQFDPRTKKYIPKEGNCRTVCFWILHDKYPEDERWQSIPAKVLPKDADPRFIAILLADWHVGGKIEWRAHEKAAQVKLMHAKLKMPVDEIALYMRASKTTVLRLLAAHTLMTEKFLTIDEDAYADQGEGKWSFFEEFFKSKDLRHMLKDAPDLGDDFCRWVGDERLPNGADVRGLSKILKNDAARKKFETGHVETALIDATKLLAQSDPSIDSDFFKLLGKMRESVTNAAQVKEILKIRTDKVARQHVLDTYEALVDFMKLADVDPDQIDSKPVKTARSA